MALNLKEFIIHKPWGYEFLVFESKNIALWLLYIKQGYATSMHCHPSKTTGLLVVDGTIEISFITDKRKLVAYDKAMIRRGLFHSTKALNEKGAFVLEVETPNDKEDLVRLTDSFGRSSMGYESRKDYTTRSEQHLWITEFSEDIKSFEINNQNFLVINLRDIKFFESIGDKDIVIFLRGGLGKNIDGRKHLATMPGDVIKGNILRILAQEMEFLENNSFIIYFKSKI